MVIVHFIGAGVLLVILQTTIFMRTPISLLSPDLHYILVAYLAFRLDLLRSLIILFPLACVLDVLSGTVLGMYGLSCFGGYFLLRQVSTRLPGLPINEALYQIFLISLSFLGVSWVIYLFLDVFSPGQQVDWSWWKMLVRMALVAGATYPLFFLFDILHKYSQRRFLPWNRLRLRGDDRRRRAA